MTQTQNIFFVTQVRNWFQSLPDLDTEINADNINGSADHRAFAEELAREAEGAAVRGEQSQLYRITKQVCGKYQSAANLPIKIKEGKLLITQAEQDACWAEHFRGVLNREPPEEGADIQETEIDLDINVAPPTKEEIVMAIKKLIIQKRSIKPQDKTT